MNQYWSKDEYVENKNKKVSYRALKNKALFLSKFSLGMSIFSFVIYTSALFVFTAKELDIKYKVSFLNGKIQDL